MDAFIEHLLYYSSTCSPAAILPRGPQPVNLQAGILSLHIVGEAREVPLMPLFAEYCRLDAEDKWKFLGYVFTKYILKGEVCLPCSLLCLLAHRALRAMNETEDSTMTPSRGGHPAFRIGLRMR